LSGSGLVRTSLSAQSKIFNETRAEQPSSFGEYRLVPATRPNDTNRLSLPFADDVDQSRLGPKPPVGFLRANGDFLRNANAKNAAI